MVVPTDISYLHQILIVNKGDLPEPLPVGLADNSVAARAAYPEAKYRLWSQTMLQSFIAENYPPEVLWAFDKLQPYSYKSDLARFCLLHHFGGLYVDLGVRIAERWDLPPDCGLAAFRDVQFVTRSWSAMQTGLIWSNPGRRELENAIKFIIENCRNKYYGRNPLYPTGPVVFGRACIAAVADSSRFVEDQYVGECRCLTPDSEMLNVVYVSREGRVIAFRTKHIGGDLRHLGVENTNNYNELWRSRQIYGETTRLWRGDDPLLEAGAGAERTELGIRALEAGSGWLLYGPYVNLEAGAYRLRVVIAPEIQGGNLSIEVCALVGSLILFKFETAFDDSATSGSQEFRFVLDEPQREVEFRISTLGAFRGIIESVELHDEPTRTWRHSDPRIGVLMVPRDERGVLISRGVSGRVIYGPYALLKPGIYRLEAIFAANIAFSTLRIEVCCDRGATILNAQDIVGDPKRADREIGFVFRVVRLVTDAEFRIEVFGDFDGVFQYFELTRLSEAAAASTAQGERRRSFV